MTEFNKEYKKDNDEEEFIIIIPKEIEDEEKYLKELIKSKKEPVIIIPKEIEDKEKYLKNLINSQKSYDYGEEYNMPIPDFEDYNQQFELNNEADYFYREEKFKYKGDEEEFDIQGCMTYYGGCCFDDMLEPNYRIIEVKIPEDFKEPDIDRLMNDYIEEPDIPEDFKEPDIDRLMDDYIEEPDMDDYIKEQNLEIEFEEQEIKALIDSYTEEPEIPEEPDIEEFIDFEESNQEAEPYDENITQK